MRTADIKNQEGSKEARGKSQRKEQGKTRGRSQRREEVQEK
jgi:hypothetical protein